MKNYKFIQVTLIVVIIFFSSCNSFLDELPDNRTTIDSEEKIGKLLASAYPYSHYSVVTELSSDNVVDTGEDNPNTERFYNDIATWKDGVEKSNDDLTEVWQSCYSAIANANEALKAIEELGTSTKKLKAFKGEALIARAYSHFVLVNLFSKHYNKKSSDTDLGITYMYEPEVTLKPTYTRGTVKEVYESIEKDIEQGLPLVDDNVYSVPKYHFNKKASYAFAARFNLYYEKWQKAVKYASLALGSRPSSQLRDWQEIGDLPQKASIVAKDFIQADKAANLLLQTNSSKIGLMYGPYYECARYTHTSRLASLETVATKGPWGGFSNDTFWLRPFVYSSNNLEKNLLPKLPYIFQYTDIVAQTGFIRTINVLFSTDETLLIRAEAQIMLKNYEAGVADLNLWTKKYLRKGSEFTKAQLEDFYANQVDYSSESKPTQKKVLSPKFTLESGTQENLIHCVLQYRRILTLHEGLRWFDIKRYGIEVNRYKIEGVVTPLEKLTAHDNRKAFQLPQEVLKSGLTPNPR